MKKLLFTLTLIIGVATIASSQVLWDLRTGVAFNKKDGMRYSDAFYYMVELGIDIPIKQHYALEAAFRYKSAFQWDGKDMYWYDEDSHEYIELGRANLLELPIRFGYKFILNKNSKIRLSAGPYVSAGLDNGFRYYQSGLSTAATYEYKRFNVGLNYNVALHKGFDNIAGNGLFVTLGLKFGNTAWKAIGQAAMIVGEIATVVAPTSDNQTASDTEVDTMPSNNPTKTTISSASNTKDKQQALDKQNRYMHGNYQTDLRTYSKMEDRLRNMDLNPSQYSHLSNSQYCNEVKKTQQEMRKLREKIVSNGGTRSKSSYEDWVPAQCK